MLSYPLRLFSVMHVLWRRGEYIGQSTAIFRGCAIGHSSNLNKNDGRIRGGLSSRLVRNQYQLLATIIDSLPDLPDFLELPVPEFHQRI